MQQAETPRWYQGSTPDFCAVAKRNPEGLLAILKQQTLSAFELREAAEATRFLQDTKQAIGPLLELSYHPARVVREGAVGGLRTCALRGDDNDRLQIHKRLRTMSKDAETSVKELVAEALED